MVAYRSMTVTPDTAAALRVVQQRAAALSVALQFKGVKRMEANWRGDRGPTKNAPPLSLRPAGREVQVRTVLPDFEGTDEEKRQAEVSLAWGILVPCGFIPWLRYPVAGDADDVFHCFGPWQGLYDHLLGHGRGETAWPSVCAAAQSDVGTWEGGHRVERFVQAQLHRLGVHCGPVDGIVGEQTTAAIRALGLKGLRMTGMAQELAKWATPSAPKSERTFGHVIVPGQELAVVSTGKVYTSRTTQGVALTIDGPGKVIVNIGGEV
jgi:hypothetical protein